MTPPKASLTDWDVQQMSQQQIFDSIAYEPHIGQVLGHRAKQRARFRALPDGRRWGKSQFGGHELTDEAHRAYHERAQLEPKGKRHEYWIVGPEYSDAEKEFRVVYNDLTKLGIPFDHPGTYYDATASGGMDISLFGGRFLVHAKSAKYPQTLVGEGLQGVIMSEAAKLKEIVWIKYIRPMLADYAKEGAWALFTSTPEGKNWFYQLYMNGQDKTKPDWWSRRAPSWDNPFLFPEGRNDPEIKSLEDSMSAEKFKQEIGAEFTEFVGRVFKDFDEEVHVTNLKYNPALPTYIAEDSGFTNPSVAMFLQVDAFDNVSVIGEYYRTGRDPGEFAEDVWEDPKLGPLARAAVGLYPDPADPGTAKTLSNKWHVEARKGTGGEIQQRLELMRRWLRPQPIELPAGHPEKKPKLMFDYSCVNAIREFNDYRYPETKAEASTNPKENPLKLDDHVPEAMGRFFIGHFGREHIEKRKAKVSNANFGS